MAKKTIESFSLPINSELHAPLLAIDALTKVLAENYKDHIGNIGLTMLKQIEDNSNKMKKLLDDLVETFLIEKRRHEKEYGEILDKIVMNEKRYCSLLENSEDGIIILSQEAKATYVSPTITKMLGYSEDELLMMDIYTIMHPDDFLPLGNIMVQVMANPGLPIKGHTGRMMHKDGSWRWIEAVATNMLHDPLINGIIDNFRDITAKKNLEDLLHKANSLARIGNWEFGMQTKNIYWSPVTKELHEVRSDFIPNIHNALNFYKEGYSRDTFHHAVTAAIESFIPFDMEAQIITAKGNERWIRIICEVETLTGKCIRLYGSFQDIDASKKAELKIAKAYQEKKTILESIGDGFYALDDNWVITYWNKAAENFLGRKREEVVGKNIWEEYPDIIDTIFYTQYQKAFKEKTIQQFEAYYATLNVWAEVSVYPASKGLSVYFRNITQRKHAEELLRISQSNLKIIIENTDATIYSLDKDLRYIVFNQKLEKSLKEVFDLTIQPGDMVYEFLEKLNPSEAREWQKIYAKALDGEIVKFEKVFNVGETDNYVSFSIHPIMENDKIIGVTCYAIDITQRKKAETELIELNEQLRNLSSHLQTIREDERKNIAREVHDELGQQMTSLKMDIEWIMNMTTDNRPSVKQKMISMLEMTYEAIRTIRRIIISLRPGILDDLGLEAAIEWQAMEFEKNTGITCQFHSVLVKENFSSEINTAVFRIFQESLTNITRHAQATQAVAYLYEKNAELILEVKDNGIGISDDRKNNKLSFGLMGMKERAGILNGTFDISRQNSNGTIVILKIPI